MKQEYADFPLAIKAFAAAQAERILQNSSATLAWFDGNPSSMYPLMASEINNDIIELTGTGPLLELTSKYLKHGDYLRSLFLDDMLLSVYPEMDEAMDLRRESLLQLIAISDNYIERLWLNYALPSYSP